MTEMSALLDEILPPTDSVRETHHFGVDPVPRAVREVRGFVRARVRGLADETESSVLLLTSELVTNAVLHARTRIEVTLALSAESVVVLVHDEDVALPEQDPYGPREGGWGLGLVQALADSWAMHRQSSGGKTVWFRVLRAGSRHVEDGAAARRGPERRDS